MSETPARADSLRPMKTARIHGRAFLAARILRQIWNHPANEHCRRRAVLRSVTWQVRKRSPRSTVNVSAYGLHLNLPRMSGSLSNFFYFGESFEWSNIEFIRRYLRPGDTVLDVGANVGMFSYAALQMVGSTGHVTAVEPLPWAAHVIEANASLNHLTSNFQVRALAVSESAGTTRFVADADVSSHISYTSPMEAQSATIEVKTAALDDLIGAGPVSLVKLDVEGAEHLALRGFRGHLASGSVATIILEAHDHSLREMGSSRSEVVELLAAFGYRLFSYDAQCHELSLAEVDTTDDVIAVHESALKSVIDRLSEASRRSVTSGRDPHRDCGEHFG